MKSVQVKGCGCCKPSIIRKLTDGVSARDFSAGECKELDIAHEQFESFHDVIQIIKALKK